MRLWSVHPKYFDRQMCRLVFGLMGSATPSPDPFPPQMLRIGDAIDVGGNIFVIADDGGSIASDRRSRSSSPLRDSRSSIAAIVANVCSVVNRSSSLVRRGS